MSIFGSIVSKIFGHAAASPAPVGQTTASAAPTPSAPANDPSTPSAPTMGFNNPQPAPSSPGSTTTMPQPANTNQAVDVAAILTDLASKNAQNLDWRHSIVDMMKLLGLDSSLSARQELAKELHYSGSSDDSASMNMWLHKQVMQKLAENGGKVPDDLK